MRHVKLAGQGLHGKDACLPQPRAPRVVRSVWGPENNGHALLEELLETPSSPVAVDDAQAWWKDEMPSMCRSSWELSAAPPVESVPFQRRCA